MSKYITIFGNQGSHNGRRICKYVMGENEEKPCDVAFELKVSV